MSSPATCTVTVRETNRDPAMELLQVDDRLQEEMQRLAAINQELLGNLRPEPAEASEVPQVTDELTLLRGENAELHARVQALEQALQAAPPADASWAEQQKEYETLLEEKSEVIRTLHLKIQQLQEGGTDNTAAAPISAADQSDIDTLKRQMAEQRKQLEDDEEALMQQMRQMEMAMSKDRAELARQRNEIQRLTSELNHEIENASRDPGLRERLTALQRLQGEMSGRKPAAGAVASAKPAAKAAAAKAPAATAPAAAPEPDRKKSGLFGRIFGK